jgi:hypothetical protein
MHFVRKYPSPQGLIPYATKRLHINNGLFSFCFKHLLELNSLAIRKDIVGNVC